MPLIYHAVPRRGFRCVPHTLSLLVEDEGQSLRRVFLEYRAGTEVRALRLLPTDGYKGEDHYSLYTVRVPAEALDADRFFYCFSVDGVHSAAYEFPLICEDAVFNGDVEIPALLPLDPPECFYLSQGDLCLRYLSFPWEEIQVRVLVQVRGEWCDYAATQNEVGEWECRLLASLLSGLGGKLVYFAELAGKHVSACLGSEAMPLSLRLVDDAGPVLTSIYPADGERVRENPPKIRVTYEDASGIDLAGCALYLDGKNVGESAIWTANGMSFCPKMPLDGGEHTLEIVLRDTHGNRTYRHVSFFVKGKDVATDAPPKKPMSAVHAARFFAGAFVTLKKLFLNKEE